MAELITVKQRCPQCRGTGRSFSSIGRCRAPGCLRGEVLRKVRIAPEPSESKQALRALVQEAIDLERSGRGFAGLGLLAKIIHKSVVVILDAVETDRETTHPASRFRDR